MKKSYVLITLIVVVVLILLYIFIHKGTFDGGNGEQAAVIQSTERNVRLPADAFLNRIEEPNMTLIDIRTKQEYDSGHIDGAINIDFYASDFAQQLDKLEKAGAYSIYCRSGSRSGVALGVMKDLGFTNVADLQGGYASLPK